MIYLKNLRKKIRNKNKFEIAKKDPHIEGKILEKGLSELEKQLDLFNLLNNEIDYQTFLMNPIYLLKKIQII